VIVLTLLAFLCAGLALLPYVIGLPALARYFRNADLRRLGKGPTPPISLMIEAGAQDEDLTALLRQNYPEFELVVSAPEPAADLAPHPAAPDIPVRHGGARYEIVAGVARVLHPDPLFLRDIGHALDGADGVVFAPVVFGPRTLGARLLTLVANSDAFLSTVASRGQPRPHACFAWRANGSGRPVLAPRAVRVRMPRGNLLDLAWLSGRSALRIPGSLARGLLVAAAVWTPHTLAALLVLGLLVLLRAGTAAAVDLRFAWDRSTLRSLPLLPLLWVAEPIALLAGLFGPPRHRVRLHDS
jgi:hypothetical protein